MQAERISSDIIWGLYTTGAIRSVPAATPLTDLMAMLTYTG